MEIQQSQLLQEQDNDRYEIDTREAINNLYYTWLGMVPDESGVYVEDRTLNKRMNTKGASFLKSEILPRFNSNLNFSELEDNDIRSIATETAENCANVLKYRYSDFGISVGEIKDICDQIEHSLSIWLRIARNGGMKSYRTARSQVNTVIHKREEIEGGVQG